MNRQRMMQAERLFDAIGLIDDRIVAEADAPFERKKTQISFRRIAAIASTFAICLVIFFGVSVFMRQMDDDTYDNMEDIGVTSDASEGAVLSATLMSYKSDESIAVVSYEEIDLFSGEANLIWRYDGEDDYRVVSVTKRAAAELRAELQKNEAAIIPLTEKDEILCEVWICYGDGTVVSPYLRHSDGNVGYGELFDYKPEIEPGKELVKLINDLISD